MSEVLLRAEHLGEGAEMLDELLGERLDVALRDRAEEQQLEQLVVGQGGVAGVEEALAQTLAMAEMVRLGVVRGGGNRG